MANVQYRLIKSLGRGLIMPEPKSYGSELCHGKVVRGDTVEACRDVPELFEFSDASFDEVRFLYVRFE